MEYFLVCFLIALFAYSRRYAFSGVDNGLYYEARRLWRFWERTARSSAIFDPNALQFPPRPLKEVDIHYGEVWQQRFAHLAFGSLLGGAFLWHYGLSLHLLKIVPLFVAQFGAMSAGSYHFQRWIQLGVASEQEGDSWELDGKMYRKRWANKRGLQFAFGIALVLAGIIGFVLLEEKWPL